MDDVLVGLMRAGTDQVVFVRLRTCLCKGCVVCQILFRGDAVCGLVVSMSDDRQCFRARAASATQPCSLRADTLLALVTPVNCNLDILATSWSRCVVL